VCSSLAIKPLTTSLPTTSTSLPYSTDYYCSSVEKQTIMMPTYSVCHLLQEPHALLYGLSANRSAQEQATCLDTTIYDPPLTGIGVNWWSDYLLGSPEKLRSVEMQWDHTH
jgi:hypothetical protein